MNLQSHSINEERLQETAQQLRYPPAPDVAGAVMRRIGGGGRQKVQLRSAWVLMGLFLLALAILFAVPVVRAEIIRFLQVGVVRIFPSAPTLTTEPSLPQSPITATPIPVTPNIITPVPGVNEPIYAVTISELAGETTLADAQASLTFPIQLPTFPSDLGAPDRVFLQENDQMVILVWTDPDNPDEARLSLHEISPGSVIIGKFEPRVIQETQVYRNYAVWAVGPYLVQLTSGSYDFRRTVEGNTLIWEEDEITYRLETDLSLEEATKIAESLK